MEEQRGFIKLFRKSLDNPLVCKDSDHLAIWVYLLLKATHKDYKTIFKGAPIDLKPGQLITGRKAIASFLHIDENKVGRVLKLFEGDRQIERQPSNQNTLISILRWSLYQRGKEEKGFKGYVKIQRKWLDDPVICKDSDFFAVWLYLLLNAKYKPCRALFGGATIPLSIGQQVTEIKTISPFLNIDENKTQNILKTFKGKQLIEQQTSGRKRLISVVNWNTDQLGEQADEQQMNSERTTDEHIQEGKKEKKERNKYNAIVPGATVSNCAPTCVNKNNDVVEVIRNFQQYYEAYSNAEHPVLKKEQWDRVYKMLEAFAYEYEIGFESFDKMIEAYFNSCTLKTDCNINHFATKGILTNLFLQAVY